MRPTRILDQLTLTLTAGALLLVIGGCPKHENFPTELALVQAAAPDSFEITSQGVNESGGFDYDLAWQISDETNVDHYRLYLVGAGIAPEFVHATDADETSDRALPVTLPFNGQGLQFGLTTVSTGLVESAMTFATIPPSP